MERGSDGGAACRRSSSRRRYCLLFSVVLMFLCEVTGELDITQSVNKLGETLRKNMLKPVNYTRPNVNTTYLSSAKFDPRGMGTLYNVTNFFMDLVLSGDAFPQGVVIMDNDNMAALNFTYVKTNYVTLLRHYGGVAGVTIAGLLFALIMPLAGFIFCCCRCAGRCGARSEPFEKRHDPCKRYTLGIFLAIIATVILFGVVCAFVTNQYMEAGVKQLPSRLRVGIHDADLFMTNTNEELRTLLVKNYQELEEQLVRVLNNTGETVQEQLSLMSNATILTNLSSLVVGLRRIQYNMGNISVLMYDLQDNATDLNTTLNAVRKSLSASLEDCRYLQECNSLLNQVKDMHSASFNNYLARYLPELPSIESSVRKVKELFNSSSEGGGIAHSVQKGIEQFDAIHSDIQGNISQKIPDVTEALNKAGKAIKDVADKITDVVKNAQSSVPQYISWIDKGQRYIDWYSWYRYYVDMGLSVLLLLILLCITFGLFYGFCGKRPDEYGNDCCNRGSGAKCLIAGVAFMFLFSIVLMVLTLAHFLVGMASEKVICEPLADPENSSLFSYLDKMTNLTDIYTTYEKPRNVNLSSVITSCHANNSLYEVLQLSSIVNITQVDDYETVYNITGMVNDLRHLTFSFSKNFVILPKATKRKLRELSKTFSGVNFTEFSQIQDSIVSIDLMRLATDLNETSRLLKSKNLGSVAETLSRQAEVLRITQEKQVTLMARIVSKLKVHTSELEDTMKFNHSSLSEAIKNLIVNVEFLENYMTYNGSEVINSLVGEFLDSFLNHITKYLHWVVESVLLRVGQCGPISNVYNAIRVSTCHQVLDPFNGFWASIGWSLVLFIPAIILSVKLATLYNKTDPYPGPLVESEYLYDAYADHDNIPLANHDKKHHHRRYDETYDNSTGYVSEYGGRDRSGRGERSDRGGTGGSHHGDARYNDMAPNSVKRGYAPPPRWPDHIQWRKNWDYPNGGPPNYHSPPLSTEYERPPPYYYPGPGESRR